MNVWTQIAFLMPGVIAFSGESKIILEMLYANLILFIAFSALRAYALSNRSRWIVAVIIFLALPLVAMCIMSVKGGIPGYGC